LFLLAEYFQTNHRFLKLQMDERYELNSLISTQITKETELKENLMKKIKQIVKQNELNVNISHDQLFHYFKSNDSKVLNISFKILEKIHVSFNL
jgi:hypothetical protein